MAISVWDSADVGHVGSKLKEILDHYPGDHDGLYVTSAYRPGENSHHGGLVYGGSNTAAIDIGFNYGSSGYQKRARELAEWLYQFSGDTVELIISKVGTNYRNNGVYVKHQRRVGPYAHRGSNASVRHENHIHFATSEALADRILSKLRSKEDTGRTGRHRSGSSQREYSLTPYENRPGVCPGDYGTLVSHLQWLLERRLNYDVNYSGGESGVYDDTVKAAVKDALELSENSDACVGNSRWARLETLAAFEISYEGRPVLRRGSKGKWVGYLQHALRQRGYNIDKVYNFPFGPQTEAAVLDFKGTDNDEVIGPYNWEKIDAVMKGEDPDEVEAPEGGDETEEPSNEYDNNDSPLYGWDASDYDHQRGMRPRHVREAAKQGIKFFTHKITEGTSVTHNHAGSKVQVAVDAGIPFVGVYVVPRTPGLHGHGSVSEQVDFAVEETSRQWPDWHDHPGFFWQVDLEHWEYDNVDVEHGVEMCARLEQETGKGVVLYAPRWAYGDSIPAPWNEVIWNSDYSGSGSPANYKTQWNRTAGSDHPGLVLMSGKTPAILQYASDAVIGGQNTTDANIYFGTESDFAEMINTMRA